MARFLLLLLLTFAAVQISSAQAPVPDGQAASTVALSGTVQGSGGKIFAGITVTARSRANSGEVSVKTNAAGEFRFSLRPGRYTVTATPDAFPPATKEVDLSSNQAITIRVSDERPVPVPTGERSSPDGNNSSQKQTSGQVSASTIDRGGTSIPNGEISNNAAAGSHLRTVSTAPPDVPMPASGAVAVSGVFSNSLDLASWLNGQAARNLRLQAIVSAAQGNQNLFVWIAHAGADQHFVISADQISNPNDLQSVLKAYPQATLIGLAWVQHDRFLVLRSNP